jgi:hypothetical protein
MPGTAEEALTSTPARPISEGNTFSFKGSSTPAPVSSTPQEKAANPPKGKLKISVPVLLVVGLVFIIVWGIFWAIILGFIKR